MRLELSCAPGGLCVGAFRPAYNLPLKIITEQSNDWQGNANCNHHVAMVQMFNFNLNSESIERADWPRDLDSRQGSLRSGTDDVSQFRTHSHMTTRLLFTGLSPSSTYART
jgi:hypothetical protein